MIIFQLFSEVLTHFDVIISEKLVFSLVVIPGFSPSVIDLHMLQAKVLPVGVQLPKLVNQLIEAKTRGEAGFCILRFMRRLTFNNQTSRETISEAWAGWPKLVDDLIRVVGDEMKFCQELLDFVSFPSSKSFYQYFLVCRERICRTYGIQLSFNVHLKSHSYVFVLHDFLLTRF